MLVRSASTARLSGSAGYPLHTADVLSSRDSGHRCSRPMWRHELPPGGESSEQSWHP
jgi:hypothetical protein